MKNWKEKIKIENFKNANSIGVNLTWEELENLIQSLLTEMAKEFIDNHINFILYGKKEKYRQELIKIASKWGVKI